jgi:hypothetical protein
MLIPLIIIVSIGGEFLILLKKWFIRRPSKQDRKLKRKTRREEKYQGEIPFKKRDKKAKQPTPP